MKERLPLKALHLIFDYIDSSDLLDHPVGQVGQLGDFGSVSDMSNLFSRSDAGLQLRNLN